MKNKIQLDATYYFIMLMLGSTCFGHHYVYHQELTTGYSLRSGHSSILPALNLQPAATREPDGLCRNQNLLS